MTFYFGTMKSVLNILPPQYDIAPLLEKFRDAVSQSGEHVPDSWVDERLKSIAAGQEYCLGVVGDKLQGILVYGITGSKTYGFIAWGEGKAGREDLLLLIKEYIDRAPQTTELRISGVHPGVESELLGSVAAGFNFSFKRRYEMGLQLKERKEMQKPEGFEFKPILEFTDSVLSSLDMKAYEGTVDEHLIAETEEENRVLMKSLLSGDYGPVIADASLCALRDKMPVGMIAVTDLGDDAFVADIAVLKEYRGTGLGKYLLCNAIDRCIDLKKKRLTLWVSEGNVPALSLYNSLGFERIREGDYYFLRREGKQ